MPPHWGLRDIKQTMTKTGYKITVWTFQPCHLWLRWSTTEPEEHLVPRTIRGVPLKSDKYFCFVAYQDNEQEEDGDSYIHHFTKEPWPHCETRWFYFHGTMDEQYSPSTSAIFRKHRWAPEWLPIIIEPWGIYIGPPNFTRIMFEHWTVTYEPPALSRIILEEWTS